MMRYLLIIGIISLSWLGNIRGQSKAQLQSERNHILDEIELLNKNLESTKESREATLNEFLLLDRKLVLRQRLIDQMTRELQFLQSRINDNQLVIESLQSDLKKIKDEYAKMIYYYYKNKDTQNKLMYILAAESFNQAYKRFKYLQQYSAFRKNQVKLINAVHRTLYNQILIIEDQIEEKATLQKQKEDELAQFTREKRHKEQQIVQLRSKEEDLLKQIKKQQEIAEKLEAEISRLIAEESKRSENRAYQLTPEEQLVSDDFRKNRGRLPWPTQQGIVIRGFGEHEHPILKGTKIRNDGIDISTVKGSDVRALFNGEVKRVFSILGANSTIIIRHGNFLTVYHNIVDVRVKAGDVVSVKEVIGKVPSDDKSETSTIHIEIWEEFTKLNPELWLSKYDNS
ncbi:MAG: murein hydrolase activator EnvC family protein [Cyclobacteriaceae bacterium]